MPLFVKGLLFPVKYTRMVNKNKTENVKIKRIIYFLIVILLQPLFLFSQSDNDIHFEYMGKIKPRHAKEIQASKISVGAETMDRDYLIYANFKDYLGPLGAKKARIQSGWAKTEKEKGVYNWAWMDEIIFDMVEQGVEPWVNLSYGNSIYPGGGGERLTQKELPSSEEALKGWERYITAIVSRYKNYVNEWEIWNEPNYGIDPAQFGRFVVLTTKAIKSVQPDAIVAGIALGSGVDYKFADEVLAEIEKQNGIHLIDQIAHHRHITAPEANEPEIELERVIDKYSQHITARQGEAGCPSKYSTAFAMNNQDWSEMQQSKHILRRLMLDLGRDKETCIFLIMDSRYVRDGKPVWNYKGLLAANEETMKVDYKKPAYYAMQHVTSIFDFTLEPLSVYPYEAKNDKDLYVFGHENIHSGKQAVAVWFGNNKPTVTTDKQTNDLKLYNGNFKDPVLVDLRTGEVFQIPEKNWNKNGTIYSFNKIPVYDSPVLIIDKSLILMEEE